MSIVWDFDNSGDNFEKLKQIIEHKEYDFVIDSIIPPYALSQYVGHNIKIIIYQKSVMAQGGGITNPNNIVKSIIIGLDNLNFLILKENSNELFQSFLPQSGLIVCNICNTANTYIQLNTSANQPTFIFNKCGCELALKRFPLHLMCRRLLPDLNIIISDALIRLFDLGFFENFEIVIPNFLLEICNKKLFGKKREKKISEFIEKCIELKTTGFLKIINFIENEIIKFKNVDSSNFDQIEDKIFLEMSRLTNSIFITSDNNLKAQFLLNELPLIYIDAKKLGQLKAFNII